MGKKKAAKKLTPLGRERRLRLDAEKELRSTGEALVIQREDFGRNLRGKENLLTDKNATIARQEDLLTRAREDVTAARAERDRLMRVVDQFTSVQIIGHGQVISQHSSLHQSQQPGVLRKS